MALRTVFGNNDHRGRKTLTNKEYYKTLIESKKEAAFLVDVDGDLLLLNQQAQQLTGFTETEIGDYHVRDLFVTSHTSGNPFDARQFSEFSTAMFLMDARRYLIPVLIDFKEIEGQRFLGLCTPVREQGIALPASGPEVAKTDPVMTISQQAATSDVPGRWSMEFEHQVRNVLNNMLGFSAIIAKDPVVMKEKKLHGKVESIIKTGNQLKTLLNKISIGNAEVYEIVRTSCQLGQIIQKAQIMLDPLVRQNNQTIRVIQPEAISVFTDEFLLLELLKFLLGKAIQYTRNEHVTVEVKPDPGQQNVIVTIDNLGQEIPQGIINFIRREQSRDEYDLNNPILAQSPEIKSILKTLNLIDGKLLFSAGEHHEEIAQVILPLSSQDESVDVLTQIEKDIVDRSLKILIVEDDKFNAAILDVFLEPVAAISTAYSGNEALNMAEGYYNKGIVFNLVVMDIGLPEPWDGILLKLEMEKRWPDYQKIPFLAQTAFSAKSISDRIAENDFRGHLVKPLNRSDLLRYIHRLTK
jgi:CheY-like chemotaxis protein